MKQKIHQLIQTVTVMAITTMPMLALADDATFSSEAGKACKFIQNIHTILNLMSVTVVTVAIIFAGYQIAFAHKRISDVAPIFIGGLLIGAAGQIAKMLVEGSDACSAHSMLHIMQIFV